MLYTVFIRHTVWFDSHIIFLCSCKVKNRLKLVFSLLKLLTDP